MSAGNFYQNDNASQSNSRIKLFANVGSYSSADVMRSSAAPRYRTDMPSYSDAMLDQMESQTDEQISGLTSKVRMLKDISLKIGEEVRDSSTLLSSMENRFEATRASVKNTMTRMIRTSKQHGIGLKQWAILFGFVWVVFFLVWLL